MHAFYGLLMQLSYSEHLIVGSTIDCAAILELINIFIVLMQKKAFTSSRKRCQIKCEKYTPSMGYIERPCWGKLSTGNMALKKQQHKTDEGQKQQKLGLKLQQ